MKISGTAWHTHIPLALLALALVNTSEERDASGGTGGEPKAQRPSPDVEPRATQLLKQMSDEMSSLSSFGFTAAHETDVVLESGQKLQIGAETSIIARRPDHVRSRRKGEVADVSFYCDGDNARRDAGQHRRMIGLATVLVVLVTLGTIRAGRLGVAEALAVVGYPATPGSVAGVARRTSRRTARRTNARYASYPGAVSTLPGGCAKTVSGGTTIYVCGSVRYRPYYDGPTLVYVPMSP